MLSFAPASSAEAVVLDRVVAVVNGEAVTRSELEARWRETRANPELRNEFRTREVLLSRLIEMRLERQRARELGLSVAPGDVDREVHRIMADNGIGSLEELKTLLAREGTTLEAVRKDLEERIMAEQLMWREVRSRVRVSEAEVRRYYEAHQDELSDPPSFRLRQILFSLSGLSEGERAEAEAAIARVREQAHDRDSFLAAESSLAGTPGVKAGPAGEFRLDELSPELAKPLSGLKEGEVSPALNLRGGTVALFLLDRLVQPPPPAYEAAAPLIRERLGMQKMGQARSEWMDQLRRNAHIEIRELGQG